MSKMARKEEIEAYLYILPWFIGFGIFLAGPLLYSIFLSTTTYSGLGPPEYIGLGNYQRAFTDPLFYKVLYNTLYYTGCTVVFGTLGSLGCALLLSQKLKGISIYRTFFFLPSLIFMVASALIWVWILEPEFGLLNYALSKLGIKGPRWFQSVTYSMPGLIIIRLWKMGGLSMIIFLAALQSIPTNLYDAAKIDGAKQWHSFIYVTLPMLSSVIFFVIIWGIIESFSVFATVFVTTKGGPAHATLVYVLYLYQYAFEWFEMGYGSALAWLMFCILLTFTYFYFRHFQQLIYYAGERRR